MKKNKMLIISIISIVIITAIIIAILYLNTDLFKTNQQLFYKYLSKTKMIDSEFINNIILSEKRIKNNTNSSTTTIDIESSKQNEITHIADIQNLLNIKSNGLKNVELKQEYRDFTVSSNNQQLITLKYIRDNNLYALGAENILAKYISVENSNLKELCSKMGITDTSKIPNIITDNIEQLYNIDSDTLNILKEKYFNILYSNISKEHFSIVKNEDKTNAISVSLTQQETVNLIKLMLDSAKSDTILLNLILEKAQLLGYKEITVENIQTQIQNKIDEISKETYSSEPNFIKISLIKNEKDVLKFKVEVNSQETKIDVTKNVKKELEIDFSEKGKTAILFKKDNLDILKFTINYSYNNETIIANIETEQLVKEGTITNQEETQVTSKIATKRIQYQINNYQTDNIIQNCTIEIDSKEDEIYQINLYNETNIKQDVQIEKLTTENSAKLNDMSSEQIQKLFTAISNRVQSVYGEQITNSMLINTISY